MKKIIGWLLITFLFSICNVSAEDVQSLAMSQKVIVNAKWGDKSGEIGNVPLNTEDQTAGHSINPIALDKDGNIYVGDSVNSRIIKFNSVGKSILEFKFPYKFHLIEDIYVGDKNKVFALIEPAKLKIVIFHSNGTIESIIDLSNIGRVEKNKDGKTILNKNIPFPNGVRDRLFVNADDSIFIKGSDLIKINNKGEVINRAGMYVDGYFVDSAGLVFVLSIYEKGGVPDQYDKNLKYIQSGWDKYKDMLWPEKSDSIGNVYGFAFNGKQQDNNLRKYNVKKSKIYGLPIAREKLELEHWAVDSKGNIYYTESMGNSFKVIKVTPIQKGKDK